MNEKTICRNCFLCVNFMHEIQQNDTNPVKILEKNYCTLIEKELNIDECYLPHKCCLPKADIIVNLDDAFGKMETQEEAIKYLKTHYNLDIFASSDDRIYTNPKE